MTTIDTHFRVNKTGALSSFISGKTFRDDRDFVDTLEDFLFWKIVESSDIWDYVWESEIFKTLNKNIWK